MDNLTPILILKFAIYYGSWLVFPILLWFIKKRWIFLIFLSLLFIYARFIEPQIILVNDYKINTGFKAKFALISDIHLGIYNDASLLERTLEKVKNANVEALLIAGDLTYEPQFSNMKTLFASFATLDIPIYAVLGNHDCQKPGPDIRKELEAILTDLGVQVITNKAIKHKNIIVLGLGSHWAKDDEISLLDNYTKEDNLIVLMHNPDTTLDYQAQHNPDLSLAGHTHGGQVRIPWLYHKMIPIKGDVAWDQGLYTFGEQKVFVSSGLREIGLPLRFLIPPSIDILTLY